MSDDNILDMSPGYLKEHEEEMVRKYHENNKRMFKEIVDAGMAKGAMGKELERLANGGVDYSLFNLMLQRVDFTDCHSSMDAMRKMYESLWPFYSRTILENAFLRKIGGKMSLAPDGGLSNTEIERLLQILQSELDPNGLARRTLEEIKGLAKKRRELNLY